MEIKKIDYDLTVCKVPDYKEIDLSKEFFFIKIEILQYIDLVDHQ